MSHLTTLKDSLRFCSTCERMGSEKKMQNEGAQKRESVAARLGLTCAAAMVAESLTFPIDTAKTRVQLHTHSVSTSFSSSSSSVKAITGIVRQSGIKGLYRGLHPALLRHAFYTPIRITSYEYLRSNFNDSPPLLAKALLGGVSGVIGQVVASPADLVKVRMQAGGRGIEPRYRGVGEAFLEISRSEGFRGLWRGGIPNAQRAFLVNMGELSCYDQAKSTILGFGMEDNALAHSLASMISALCSTAISCPADVAKTRMMNQAGNEYSGFLDCAAKTVRREGIFALWKGFFPTLARLGPWQFFFWVSYEKFRSLAGLSSF